MTDIDKNKRVMPLDISLSKQMKMKDTIMDAVNSNLSNLGKEKFNAYNLIDAIMSVLNDLGFDILLVSEVYFEDACTADEEFSLLDIPDVDMQGDEKSSTKPKIPANFDIDKLEDAIDDLISITESDTDLITGSVTDTPFQYAYKIALKGIFYSYLVNVLNIL
jgi:hypothetical protein